MQGEGHGRGGAAVGVSLARVFIGVWGLTGLGLFRFRGKVCCCCLCAQTPSCRGTAAQRLWTGSLLPIPGEGQSQSARYRVGGAVSLP